MKGRKLILDRYRPVEQAGAGGFGTVVKAWDTRIQRYVAIKTIQLSERDAARAARADAAAAGRTLDRDPAGADAGPRGASGAAAGADADGEALSAVDPACAPANAAASDSLRRPADAAPQGSRREPLPWEDDWDSIEAAAGIDRCARPSFPADPEFLDARETRIARGGASAGEHAADQGERGAFGTSSSFDAPSSGLPGSTPLVRTLANLPGLDEARTAAMLQDQNIVSVYDFEVRDSTAYLIMEYVEGMSLSKLLRDFDDQLTLNQIAAVFEGVSHALGVAHANGVLHLDIKPDNVLIDVKGQVKVTDFGLATLADETGTGYAGGGTIGYMPPEQIDRQPLDERCDEWALAAVAYEMLSGENPFRVRSLSRAKAAIVDAELVLPSLCWDALDEEADDVLFDALDPDVDARFGTVEEFADEFMLYLGDAARGTVELASVVNCGDFDDPLDEEDGDVDEAPIREGLISRLRDRAPSPGALSRCATPRALAALAHGVGCVGSAVVSWIALSGIAPLVAGASVAAAPAAASAAAAGASAAAGAASTAALVGMQPWLALPLVVIALVGLAVPHAGALASFELLAVALIAQGHPAVGVLFAAVTAAWWFFAGRASKASANVAFSPVLAGAVGLGQVTPLAAGFCLSPARALAATTYSLVVALVLLACGSGSLSGWDVSLCLGAGGFATMQEVAARALVSPQLWCAAASWLVASFVAALFRRRRTRAFAVAGVAASGAVIGAGLVGGAWLASGGASLAPAPADCALAFASLAAMFLCCLFVPSKHDAHGGVYFADAS